MHMTYCIPKPGFHSGGWQVRSGLPGPGQTRFFADGKHGGKDAAREAAALFMLLRRPFPEIANGHAWRPENATGVPGIRVRLHQDSRVHASVYRSLFVSYTDRLGYRHNTKISLDKHGIDDAVKRALDLRGLKGQARAEARAAVLAACTQR
jgi:hypothetical protein